MFPRTRILGYLYTIDMLPLPPSSYPYTEVTVPIPLSVNSNVMIVEQEGETFAVPVIGN